MGVSVFEGTLFGLQEAHLRGMFQETPNWRVFGVLCLRPLRAYLLVDSEHCYIQTPI